MDSIGAYSICLKTIGEGRQTFKYELGDAFFGSVGNGVISRGAVSAEVSAERRGRRFAIDIALAGAVEVACDLCLDPMRQSVEAQATLVAEFGEAYSDDGELITVDERDGILDLTWLLYEQVELAIPPRHVHEAGQCNPQMASVLAAHKPETDGGEEAEAKRKRRRTGVGTN